METTQDASTQTTGNAENTAAVEADAAPAKEAPPSKLERRIELLVSRQAIDAEVNNQLRRIAKTAKLAGFRPGKVPMKKISQLYGNQATSDALSEAIDAAFRKEVRAQDLHVASAPRVEAVESGPDDGNLRFVAIFEVLPKIEIADLSAHEIERQVLEVTDAEVDKTLEVLRQQRSVFVSAGRPSQDGDRIVVDFEGRKDGEPFAGGSAENYAVMVGAGSMLPDFEAALTGVSEGEEKSFEVNFPADYHAEEMAGVKAVFTARVKTVEKPEVPALDDEFARTMGIADGDLVSLRNEVRSNLEREVSKRLRNRAKDAVMKLLLEAHPIDAPQAMVNAEAQEMLQRAQETMKGDSNLQQLPMDASWFTDEAQRRVKVGLIIGELVRARELTAKPADVRAVVDEFAQSFEDPKEVVRWYYSDQQNLAKAETLALENNVVDWVLANVKVKETPVDFDELMGGRA